ncbi:MAG: translation elongation factor Ts, partial [Candidatus Hydrothermia bacterium]
MDIPVKLVKELRDRTGAGFMDAKKALEEAGGDIEKALDVLRTRGLARADKRLDREAKEGKIGMWLSVDRSRGVILELNSETDFVARTEEFSKLLSALTRAVAGSGPADVPALLEMPLPDYANAKAGDVIKDHVARIGENIRVKRFALYLAEPGSMVDIYIHPGDMLGVILALEAPEGQRSLEIARNLAMQIAAMEPISVSRDDLPAEIVEKEKEIYRQQALEQGKPEKVIDKIVEGRLKTFYEERVLLEQAYIREQGMTVSDYLAEASKELGSSVRVLRFT